MTEELSTVYEPNQIERLADEIWAKGNYFHTAPPALSCARRPASRETRGWKARAGAASHTQS